MVTSRHRGVVSPPQRGRHPSGGWPLMGRMKRERRLLAIYWLITRHALVGPQIMASLERYGSPTSKTTVNDDILHLEREEYAITRVTTQSGMKRLRARNADPESLSRLHGWKPVYYEACVRGNADWERRVREHGWLADLPVEVPQLNAPSGEIHHVGAWFEIVPGSELAEHRSFSLKAYLNTRTEERGRRILEGLGRKSNAPTPSLIQIPIETTKVGAPNGQLSCTIRFADAGLWWTLTLLYGAANAFAHGSLFLAVGQRIKLPANLMEHHTQAVKDVTHDVLVRKLNELGLALAGIKRSEMHQAFAVSETSDPERVEAFLQAKADGLQPPIADPRSTNGVLDASEDWCNLDPKKGPIVISLEFHGDKRDAWRRAYPEVAAEQDRALADHQYLELVKGQKHQARQSEEVSAGQVALQQRVEALEQKVETLPEETARRTVEQLAQMSLGDFDRSSGSTAASGSSPAGSNRDPSELTETEAES